MTQKELRAAIIETFEDFLDLRGIKVNNPEKQEAIEQGEDPDSICTIYGTDFGELDYGIAQLLALPVEEEEKDYYEECHNLSDLVFKKFFYGAPTENDHDGLTDVPASAYQFVVSSLEMFLWETHGSDRDILKQAMGVCAYLRDQQKMREWSRR